MTERPPDFERLLTEFHPLEMRQGLFVPGDRPTLVGSTVPALMSSESVRASGLVVRGIPGQTQPIDFVATYVTAADYLHDIPEQLREGVVGALFEDVAFRTGATMCAVLLQLVEDGTSERDLLSGYLAVLKPEYRIRLQAAIDSDHPKRRLLARQPVLKALRIAIELDGDGESGDAYELASAIVASHIAGDSLVGSDTDGERSQEEYGYLPSGLTLEIVRNELFNRREDPLAVLSRTSLLWQMTPDSSAFPLRESPVDLLIEATGLSPEEWISFGFGVLAHRLSHPPADGAMWLPESFFSESEPTSRASFFEHLAADSETLAGGFDGLEPRWGFLPFERFPLIRDGGDYLLLDQQFLVDRVTNGLYWFVLDHERSCGDSQMQAWQRAFGNMLEQYILGIAERLAPPILGGGTAFYGESKLLDIAHGKSCDCAIDYGQDLVLLEVVGGRLTLKSRVNGDVAALASDTCKLVYKKAGQLDEICRTLLVDEEPLTEAPRPVGRRYFPVIVNVGTYPVNPMTMAAIEEQIAAKGWFADARVQPLAILDVGELEIAEGLQENGLGTLPEHLATWIQSDLHRVSLRNHLFDKIDNAKGDAKGDAFRSSNLSEAWNNLSTSMLSNLLPEAVQSNEVERGQS